MSCTSASWYLPAAGRGAGRGAHATGTGRRQGAPGLAGERGARRAHARPRPCPPHRAAPTQSCWCGSRRQTWPARPAGHSRGDSVPRWWQHSTGRRHCPRHGSGQTAGRPALRPGLFTSCASTSFCCSAAGGTWILPLSTSASQRDCRRQGRRQAGTWALQTQLPQQSLGVVANQAVEAASSSGSRSHLERRGEHMLEGGVLADEGQVGEAGGQHIPAATHKAWRRAGSVLPRRRAVKLVAPSWQLAAMARHLRVRVPLQHAGLTPPTPIHTTSTTSAPQALSPVQPLAVALVPCSRLQLLGQQGARGGAIARRQHHDVHLRGHSATVPAVGELCARSG